MKPSRGSALERYARQLILPEIGGEGQRRLARARVALLGLGGLGSPAALYLAAAGVGTLRLIDPDAVELSNLHRQILHALPDLGRRKVDSARDKLSRLDPALRLELRPLRLTPRNARALFRGADVVLDGSDNFPTRYAANRAAVKARIPLVWGAVARWEGQLMAVRPGRGPCYECLFPEPPDPGLAASCSDAGILGAVAGVVGSLMAVEAVKLLLGRPLPARLLTLDLLAGRFRDRPVRRRPSCPCQGA